MLLMRCTHTFKQVCTINGERFAGLKFCGFHPIKFFMGKLSRCLTFKALKQCHYKKFAIIIHGETCAVLLRSVKLRKFSPANLSRFMVSLKLS